MQWLHELKFYPFALLLFATAALPAADNTLEEKSSPSVKVSFPYIRQSGRASNQYAVWVEDAKGKFIKTLFVTNYTGQGGFRIRKDCIPTWVRRSGASNAPKADLDAVSGATPATGTQTYEWDCKDKNGKIVPPGKYIIFVEATLRWKSRVLYIANFTLGREKVSVRALPQYSVKSDNHENMIGIVSVSYTP